MQATLTKNGIDAVREFFDSIFGEGEYDLDIGILEVLDTVDAAVATGCDVSHEVTDLQGRPRVLRLSANFDFTAE
jgi:hypothetical protein